MIDHIVEFDQTRLNCKRCDEKLKMRDKSREELLGFHAELMADLAELQTFAALSVAPSPTDGGDDAAMAEPAAEGEAAEDGR